MISDFCGIQIWQSALNCLGAERLAQFEVPDCPLDFGAFHNPLSVSNLQQ
jgi:hypothetical protein